MREGARATYFCVCDREGVERAIEGSVFVA